MNPDLKNYLLKTTDAADCKEVEVIQSLWSGYGKISRYALTGSAIDSVVVKHIALNGVNEHPRGWNTDVGHLRKARSYEVEIYWYEHWNRQCTASSRTANFIGAMTEGEEQWIILEDLDARFPVRKQHLELPEVKTCLRWLANFHGTFLGQTPDGLWETGTYWHLATRPEEFGKIGYEPLKRTAHQIDELLNGCTYQTIVHGDAKLANFCFAADGTSVAAVDFQYVGGGCGMKDVTYFLGSCLSSNQCEIHAPALLDLYFAELEKTIRISEPEIDFKELEQEWRAMYPLAWTDFTRFLLGWLPAHDKVNDYGLKLMGSVLSELEQD